MDMLNQKQKFVVIILIVIAVGVIAFYYISSTRDVYNYGEQFEETKSEEVSQKNEKVITDDKEEMIIVHITGAVKTNGIVKVKANARVNDVIEAAGGITSDADLENVNLAYIVEDGQKIYIPSVEDRENINNNAESKEIVTEGDGGVVIEGESEKNDGLIDINKADIEGLKSLPGIGESTALRILEYREAHGKFKSIEDIKNVSGIGDAKFNTIKSYIKI